MEKMLARSLLSASAVALVSVTSACSAQDASAPLKQRELSQPKAVEAKLKQGVSKKDQEIAKQFFAMGSKRLPLTDKTSNFGPIVKAFGESAVHHPTPKALVLYAEASLRSWKEWSSITNADDMQKAKLEKLAEARGVFESALVANRLVSQLSDSDLQAVQRNAECISNFFATSPGASDCAPLNWLSIKR